MIDNSPLTRRRFLNSASILGGMLATLPVWADGLAKLNLPGGPDERSLTTSFPQKGTMILQRSRPPLLEAPFEVFDRGVFTTWFASRNHPLAL